MGSMSYVYNEYHAAIYAAFGPMAWCALFAWIIFTSHLGYESKDKIYIPGTVTVFYF